MPAYRAQPAQGGNFPVILVVQEIFGVHEHIKDICRRLAKLGYQAIAPELFARQGDPRQYSAIPDIISNVVSKVPDSQVMQDLDACVAWAGANGGDAKRLGITGFCWGGRITWLYAAHNPGVKAGVAWYGRLVGAAGAMTPKHPIDIAGDSTARCSDSTADSTRASRSTASTRCKPRCQRRQSAASRPRKSTSTTTPRTPSTPTTGRVIARKKPRTAGNACRRGSSSTGSGISW
jgi:dienelactone hydrolase